MFSNFFMYDAEIASIMGAQSERRHKQQRIVYALYYPQTIMYNLLMFPFKHHDAVLRK